MISVVINRKKVVKVLILVIFFLTVASITGQYARLSLGFENMLGSTQLFSLDGEGNIPTWYSSITLLVCSFFLFAITAQKEIKSGAFVKQWKFLSIIFLYLSFDEAVRIHEIVLHLGKRLFHLTGYFYHPWVIPALFFVLILFLFYIKFLIHLPTRTRNYFLFSGALYIAGALVMESIGANRRYLHNVTDLPYAICTTIEEVLEMSGVLVFMNALMYYLDSLTKEEGISIKLFFKK